MQFMYEKDVYESPTEIQSVENGKVVEGYAVPTSQILSSKQRYLRI